MSDERWIMNECKCYHTRQPACSYLPLDTPMQVHTAVAGFRVVLAGTDLLPSSNLFEHSSTSVKAVKRSKSQASVVSLDRLLRCASSPVSLALHCSSAASRAERHCLATHLMLAPNSCAEVLGIAIAADEFGNVVASLMLAERRMVC
jgi:hypothetical protein